MEKEVYETVPQGKFEDEELKAKSLRIAERELKFLEHMENTSMPCETTYYMDSQKFTYRNMALMEMLRGMSVNRVGFLKKLIKDVNKKVKK